MDTPSRFGDPSLSSYHTRTAGNNIVVVVLRLAHRQTRVRGHWRTGSNNSGVEEYLRKQSDKPTTQGYIPEIRNQHANVPGTRYIYMMSYTSCNRSRAEHILPREKQNETYRKEKMRNCETYVKKEISVKRCVVDVAVSLAEAANGHDDKRLHRLHHKIFPHPVLRFRGLGRSFTPRWRTG